MRGASEQPLMVSIDSGIVDQQFLGERLQPLPLRGANVRVIKRVWFVSRFECCFHHE